MTITSARIVNVYEFKSNRFILCLFIDCFSFSVTKKRKLKLDLWPLKETKTRI